MKIYYAHSKRIYDTKTEKKELKFLRKHFKKDDVLCPNNDIGELGSMKPYLDIVTAMHMLVCSEYQDFIGKGVFEEIKQAQLKNIPCFVLRKAFIGFKITEIDNIQMWDSGDWAIRYGIVYDKTI